MGTVLNAATQETTTTEDIDIHKVALLAAEHAAAIMMKKHIDPEGQDFALAKASGEGLLNIEPTFPSAIKLSANRVNEFKLCEAEHELPQDLPHPSAD